MLKFVFVTKINKILRVQALDITEALLAHISVKKQNLVGGPYLLWGTYQEVLGLDKINSLMVLENVYNVVYLI